MWSYPHTDADMKDALEGVPRWDGAFLEWLADKPYPIFDTRESHLEAFRRMKVSVEEYLKTFYIGHYTPWGNFFLADLLKSIVAQWLEPKPPSYMSSSMILEDEDREILF